MIKNKFLINHIRGRTSLSFYRKYYTIIVIKEVIKEYSAKNAGGGVNILVVCQAVKKKFLDSLETMIGDL